MEPQQTNLNNVENQSQIVQPTLSVNTSISPVKKQKWYEHEWYMYIPFIQFFVLFLGVFGYILVVTGFMGFSDSASPIAYLAGLVVVGGFIITVLLSIFSVKFLLKSRFSNKSIIVCTISIGIPLFVYMAYGPFIIDGVKVFFDTVTKKKVISEKLESKKEFVQSRMTSVNQKLSEPLTVKSFGHAPSESMNGLFYFFIETTDDSVLIPLPQEGHATEEEVLNNLSTLLGKKINVQLINDPRKLGQLQYPVLKNTYSFTRDKTLFSSTESQFTPTEFYFVNMSYDGKQNINLLEKELLFK